MVVSPQAADQGLLQAQDLWSEEFALPLVDPSQVCPNTSNAALTLRKASTTSAPPHALQLQDVVLVAPLGAGQAADTLTHADIAARMTSKPGHLRALLRRKLHTCDVRDLEVTLGLPQPVVWAYGTEWPSYHGATTRGDASEYAYYCIGG
jgi:hypothetical protein